MSQADPSWLKIDQAGIAGNVAWWRSRIGSARLCAVVKADAYGLGAAAVVRAVAEQVDAFAVYNSQQTESVLQAGAAVDRPVLIFMPASQIAWSPALQQAAGTGRLWLSVHGLDCLKQVQHWARDLPVPMVVHLFVDTGMCRSGLDQDALAQVLQQAGQTSSRVQIGGIYTHFATADDQLDRMETQMTRFRQTTDCHRAAAGGLGLIHAANTFAVLRGRGYCLDMVRIGLGLYGYGPELITDTPVQAPGLRQVVSWHSRLVHVRRFGQGEAVGYSATWQLKRDSLLAVVPVGYADGYPLNLSSLGQVEITTRAGRQVAPVVGRVNMDQVVVDVTDAPGVAVGDPVVLISDRAESACSLPRLARQAGSSCYEMLCRLNPRLRRCWDNAGIQTAS